MDLLFIDDGTYGIASGYQWYIIASIIDIVKHSIFVLGAVLAKTNVFLSRTTI
jgi:hypothetical protein